MQRASSFAEVKLPSKLWHKDAKCWAVPHGFPRHHKQHRCPSGTCGRVSWCPAFSFHQQRRNISCDYLWKGETHKHRLVSTCAPVTARSQQEPPPSCPAAVTQQDTYRAADSSSGQGLPRLTSVSPHFESVLSCPSPGWNFKRLSLSLLEGAVMFSGQIFFLGTFVCFNEDAVDPLKRHSMS